AVRARIRRLLFHWIDLESTLPSGLVVRVLSRPEWSLFNELFVNGEYDAALDHLLHTRGVPCEPISIVDLGASVGYFTLRAIDRVRGAGVRAFRLTAVEADEVCCRRFEQRMRENGLTSQVTLVRGAVGPRGGAGRLDVTDQLYAFRVVDPQAGGSGPL